MQYSDFIDKHKTETIVVCGCGVSAPSLKNPNNYITIGVNDIGRLFTPNYLVVLNVRNGFKGDRWNYIENSEAEVIFTQLNPKKLNIKRKGNIVNIKLGKHGGTGKDYKVDHTSNSPYVAVIIASHMGAKRIGIIGVDFTDEHFFEKTGKHPLLNRGIQAIRNEYKKLYEDLKDRNIELFNLSKVSQIGIPFGTL